jgi:hypothetical protein
MIDHQFNEEGNGILEIILCCWGYGGPILREQLPGGCGNLIGCVPYITNTYMCLLVQSEASTSSMEMKWENIKSSCVGKGFLHGERLLL